MAARATPAAGSVTQSSDVDGSDITVDQVSVRIKPDGNISVFYNEGLNSDAVVSTEDSVPRREVEYVYGEPEGTRFHERFSYDGSRAVEFYRSLGSNQVLEVDGSYVPAGDLWVDVYTDFNGTTIDETNYLAGGIWVYIPAAGGSNDYEFGAFADGGAPFEHPISDLSGEATYRGGATGVYSSGTGGGRTNEFFDADVTLMANFDTDMIAGSVHDFEVDGEKVDGNPTLTLSSAIISNNDNGFFTGTTSAEYDGDGYTGMWGGQFYNPGTSPTDLPGAVAGTFGAATTSGDETLVGVFGGYKQ